MDDSREYFEQRAAQCRRLARGATDRRIITMLTELAADFDAKAAAALALAEQPQKHEPP